MPIADAAAFFQQHCAAERDGDALLLPGWTVDDWRALLRHAREQHMVQGEVLIKDGDTGRGLFLVASGGLEVAAGGSRGVGALGGLYREGPGSVLGEISFFDGKPRTATVWATQPTALMRLDPEAVLTFSREHPELGQGLLFALGRVLAFRVRRGEGQRAKSEAY
jgi:CRP-like cAMP-binding protein